MPVFGIFGGSFNPPTVAHTLAAVTVLECGPIDGLIVVPTFEHVLGKGLLAFDHRMAMCQLAFGFLGSRVELSDIERARGGPSRTLDTIRALAAQRRGDSFRLVIGADILSQTGDWYRWGDVAKLAPPLVLARRGSALGDYAEDALPMVSDASSSEVRRHIASGRSPLPLVSRSVAAYIEEHGVYSGEGQ